MKTKKQSINILKNEIEDLCKQVKRYVAQDNVHAANNMASLLQVQIELLAIELGYETKESRNEKSKSSNSNLRS